ncbi:tetratricopeptide repeat protein [bacterium]|nr:MAG: tetratricopeptide repeat protein [bacterium]
MQKEKKISRLNKIVVIASLTAALITLLVYLPALNNQFVNWDDRVYLYENAFIRSIGQQGFFWRILTETSNCNWHPLTTLFNAVDYSLWGLNPWGHHLTSILLHSVNTFLVAILISELINQAYRSKTGIPQTGLVARIVLPGFLTALLFGIHPMHVESVAWASEKKDLLSAFFYLLCLYSYLHYATGERFKKFFYIASLLLFIMALMSKPMAISLPVALLIMDYYPLERISGIFRVERRIFTEKLPFFILGAASIPVTIYAQKACGAVLTVETYPISLRVFGPLRNYIFYLYKLAFPASLAPYYPRVSALTGHLPEYGLSLLVFIVLTFLCIFTFRRHKFFLTAYLFYIITLLPVIGIMQVGGQATADRYTYLPGLALFVVEAIAVGYLYEKARNKTYLAIVIALIFLFSVLLAGKTVKQIGIWKDGITFWSYEISVYPKGVPIAYINRAMEYEDKGRINDALEDYTKAIELEPNYPGTYINRGNTYNTLGNYEKAVADFNSAVNIDAKQSYAYNNRSFSYLRLGNFGQAKEDALTAIKIDPNLGAAYYNLSLAYSGMKEEELAVQAKQKAVELGFK